MVKSQIAYGLLIQKVSMLCTLTFVSIVEANQLKNMVNASNARRMLKAWFKKFKSQMQQPSMSLFIIPEVTMKGQTHLHLLIGNVTGNASCTKPHAKGKYGQAWRESSCVCAEHVASREWFKVTKDSYVVDVRKVGSPFGAANYLGKYLTKTFGFENRVRDQLEARGFLRRYSKSNNWPGDYKIRRKGTVEKTWQLMGYQAGHIVARTMIKSSQLVPEAAKVGNEVQLFLQREINVRRGLTKIDNSFNGQILDEVDDPEYGRGDRGVSVSRRV